MSAHFAESPAAVLRSRRARGLSLALAAMVGAALPGGCASEQELGSSFEEITVCPAGTTVQGIDVSVYQGTIDWARVRAAGKRFAFIRVGNGVTMDTTFTRNWAGARAAGVLRGAYLYFQPDMDPVPQADLVVRALGRLGSGDLPAVCDIETADGQTSTTIVARVRTFLDRVEAGTGRRPIIYTGPYFWMSSVASSTAFRDNTKLWIAHYTSGCPSVPTGFTTWAFWQNSSTGRVDGISGNVDTDFFNGTYEQLAALAEDAAPTGPEFAARYVAQSWPLASVGPIELRAGESLAGWIELRNTGTHFWDEHTHFAPSVPRDRESPFAGPDWVSPSRAAAVTGMVMPGETHRFAFTFHAPSAPGSYTEHFGMVQDGTAWFSDPMQGGPPDEQIEARLVVSPGAPVEDAGPGPDAEPPPDEMPAPDAAVEPDVVTGPDASSDAATRPDASTRPDAGRAETGADASRNDAARSDGASADGGTAPMPAGCACTSTPGGPTSDARAGVVAFALAAAATGVLRRRRALRSVRA